MSECSKHGIYSVFCRECDLETLAEAEAMTSPAELAGRLTEAQKRALLAMPTEIEFVPRAYVRSVGTWANLKAKRLIRSVDGAYGVDAHSIFTDLGLAVRAHLEKQHD